MNSTAPAVRKTNKQKKSRHKPPKKNSGIGAAKVVNEETRQRRGKKDADDDDDVRDEDTAFDRFVRPLVLGASVAVILICESAVREHFSGAGERVADAAASSGAGAIAAPLKDRLLGTILSNSTSHHSKPHDTTSDFFPHHIRRHMSNPFSRRIKYIGTAFTSVVLLSDFAMAFSAFFATSAGLLTYQLSRSGPSRAYEIAVLIMIFIGVGRIWMKVPLMKLCSLISVALLMHYIEEVLLDIADVEHDVEYGLFPTFSYFSDFFMLIKMMQGKFPF